jgi:hypothetical protein
MSALKHISEMLQLANSANRNFPATIFYNEGWMLRLVLNWFSRQSSLSHPLNFERGARWFSEALLPSRFFARARGDSLAEGWTHADGIIGHVMIGEGALANTKLVDDAQQFLVTEAKLFSPLSPRVTNASYFDQAARNVACVAEVLSKARRRPEQLLSLGFFVLAPAEQIARNIFRSELSKNSILDKVSRRISEYSGETRAEKEAWEQEWFEPVLEHIRIESLCWEDLVDFIRARDPDFGSGLSQFYTECLRFNRVQEPDLTAKPLLTAVS